MTPCEASVPAIAQTSKPSPAAATSHQRVSPRRRSAGCCERRPGLPRFRECREGEGRCSETDHEACLIRKQGSCRRGVQTRNARAESAISPGHRFRLARGLEARHPNGDIWIARVEPVICRGGRADLPPQALRWWRAGTASPALGRLAMPAAGEASRGTGVVPASSGGGPVRRRRRRAWWRGNHQEVGNLSRPAVAASPLRAERRAPLRAVAGRVGGGCAVIGSGQPAWLVPACAWMVRWASRCGSVLGELG